MWIPQTREEIESAATEGRLEEKPAVEAKRQLPEQNKNVDIAVDVAAMSTDGGVVIYGVGEDPDGRLRDPHPIELAGQAERIDQIAQTSIAEPPFIEIETVETEDGNGYLVVAVPKSPRAPHQITVQGKYKGRYYGRSAKGNRILTEGEVARLYRERGEYEKNREELLQQAISAAPLAPNADFGFLHAFIQPVVPLQDSAWDSAVEAAGGTQDLLGELRDAVTEPRIGPGGGYAPSLRHVPNWTQRGADAYALETRGDGDPNGTLVCEMNIDGRGYLFCGRAAEARGGAVGGDERLLLIEQIICGNLASFLAVFGELYARAGYHGPVDVGVAVTGIMGAKGVLLGERFGVGEQRYAADGYYRTAQVLAAELVGGEVVATQLCRRLIDTTAGEGIDPFEPVT